jgi:hypothetical protein
MHPGSREGQWIKLMLRDDRRATITLDRMKITLRI